MPVSCLARPLLRGHIHRPRSERTCFNLLPPRAVNWFESKLWLRSFVHQTPFSQSVQLPPSLIPRSVEQPVVSTGLAPHFERSEVALHNPCGFLGLQSFSRAVSHQESSLILTMIYSLLAERRTDSLQHKNIALLCLSLLSDSVGADAAPPMYRQAISTGRRAMWLVKNALVNINRPGWQDTFAFMPEEEKTSISLTQKLPHYCIGGHPLKVQESVLIVFISARSKYFHPTNRLAGCYMWVTVTPMGGVWNTAACWELPFSACCLTHGERCYRYANC